MLDSKTHQRNTLERKALTQSNCMPLVPEDALEGGAASKVTLPIPSIFLRGPE